MTSTIKVNNVQNQCGQNIINENSNTITLGASGDTIALASGASQTGFGRTGTVDWITTPKTSDFTAVSGEGYFINSAGGAVIVTLPGSPSAGNIVSVSDYNGTALTNPITIARNGSNINGDAANLTISQADSAVTLVYVDGTVGWTSVQTSNTTDILNKFVSATGGTITTVCTNFKVHTFTGPGTFTVTNAGTVAGSNTVDYLVVAGGGGGSGAQPSSSGAGGGGAGGYRESSGAASGCYPRSPLGACVSALPVTVQGYPITVGGGGSAGGPSPSVPSPSTLGANGANSIFSTITSTGGGRAGAGDGPSPTTGPSGQPGGSGGGISNYSGSPGASVGSGNTPPVSPPQGNNGGTQGAAGGDYPTGGGGGATAVGGNGGSPGGGSSGAGGAGATSNITGSSIARAGGGGGSSFGSSPPQRGCGGAGGGGTGGIGGGNPSPIAATAGTVNTGGGGGGGVGSNPGAFVAAGAGGSGIVMIRYKFQ